MTEQRMQEIADEVVNDLDPSQAGAFAAILKHALESAPYSPAQFQDIDAQLYAAGVDVSPVCRTKHPPAP